MKILFDQGTPAPLRKSFISSTVQTAAELGWGNLSNGDLVDAAERESFEILVTTDRNLRYQQNLSQRTIAIAVILESAWPVLRERAEEVAKEVITLQTGDYREI